jgi:sugar/nucleoside kinase (ribokinase family)
MASIVYSLPVTVRWDVVGFGANSVDHVVLLPAAPAAEGPNAKLPILREVVSCGGQVATMLGTCARFGLRAAYAGVTGTDENGVRIREGLAGLGIDLSRLAVREGRNQHAIILVDEVRGERIVLWDRDARLELGPADLPLDLVRETRILHVDDVDQEAAIALASAGREAGCIVTSDIDRLTPRTPALVAAVTVPIFAEHVPPALTGVADPEAALRALRRGHDGLLVVTLGAAGAMALEGDGLHVAPGFAVPVVDTTGSGDVFRGGFAYGLCRGWPVPDVLRFANAAAAASCRRLGALSGVPTLGDVEALLAGGP